MQGLEAAGRPPLPIYSRRNLSRYSSPPPSLFPLPYLPCGDRSAPQHPSFRVFDFGGNVGRIVAYGHSRVCDCRPL
eukprot:1178671-Prorocentrum_minimum.AAC.1